MHTVDYIDRIMTFAEEHDMGFRQHNLIWGRNPQGGVNQQPTWSDNMLHNPSSLTDGASSDHQFRLRCATRSASALITTWAIEHSADDEVDVYNESYHTGSNQNHASNTYWDVYGASGIASIYKESKDAIAAAGAGRPSVHQRVQRAAERRRRRFCQLVQAAL